jgi:hypothetical protein
LATVLDKTKWYVFFICKQRILFKYIQGRTEQFSKMINGDLYFLLLIISDNVSNVLACEITKELDRQLTKCDDDDYITLDGTHKRVENK